MSADYRLDELMVIEAGRQIRPGETVGVGMGPPVLAATVAKLTGRSDFAFCTEIGVFDWQPDPATIARAPIGIHDLSLFPGSAMLADMAAGLGALGLGGNVDCTMLAGAQVDRYGNVNTLVTGDYLAPERRLGGTGGNADLAATARRTVVVMPLEGRRFVERCDFITSPGYLDGPGGRRRAGLGPQGPNVVVSTMGVFGYDTTDGDDGTCELVLTAVFPGFAPDVIAAVLPWDLKVAPTLSEVQPPSPDELAWLRRLDHMHMYLREGRY